MKIYEILKTGEVQENGETRRRFAGKKGDARKLGREMNGNHRLTANCGIEITEHVITGGRAGMADFLNATAGVPPIPLKGGKAKPKAKGGKVKKAKRKGRK